MVDGMQVESIAANVRRMGKQANLFSLRQDARIYEYEHKKYGGHQLPRRSHLFCALEDYNWLTANNLSTAHLSTCAK